jgi:hypothetical protein
VNRGHRCFRGAEWRQRHKGASAEWLPRAPAAEWRQRHKGPEGRQRHKGPEGRHTSHGPSYSVPWTPRTRAPIFFLLRTENRFRFFCFFTEPLSFRAHFSTFFSVVFSTHSRRGFYFRRRWRHWRRRRRGDVRAVGPRDELEERVGRVVLFGERFPRRAERPVARDEGLARCDGLALVPRVLRVLQRDGLVDRAPLRARGGEDARAERVLERSVHKVDGDGLVEVRALAHDEVRRDGVRDVHVLRREPRLRLDEHGVAVEEVELVEGAHDELDGVLLGERARVGRADARGAPPRDLELTRARVDARDGEREVLDADVEGHHEHFFCELLGGKRKMKHEVDAVDRCLAAFIDKTGCLDDALDPHVSRTKEIYTAISTAKASLLEMSDLIEGLSDLTKHTIRHSARLRRVADPDKMSDEITDLFSSFYGREQKRANQFREWQMGGKSGKRPAPPLHSLHFMSSENEKVKNPVLLALFESGKIKTITDMLGIGADIDETLENDASLRALLGSVKARSGFGDPDEFYPAEETPATDAYAGTQLYTDPGQGLSPDPRYDPRMAAAYDPRMAAAYDPRMDAAYYPRMDAAYEPGYYGSGYDQRTLPGKAWSIFSIFRDNGIAGYICAAIVVFCLYLLLCYLLTKTGHQWWICGLYDTVMVFFKAEAYVHKMSEAQMKGVISKMTYTDDIFEAIKKHAPTGADVTAKAKYANEVLDRVNTNIFTNFKDTITNMMVEPNASSKSASDIASAVSKMAQAEVFNTAVDEANQPGINAIMESITSSIERTGHDTLHVNYQSYDGPSFVLDKSSPLKDLTSGRAVPSTMFICMLLWLFLLFVGAGKAALYTPLAIIVLAGASPFMHNLTGPGASGGTLMITLSLLTGIVHLVEGIASGKGAHEAIRDATMSTSGRIHAELNRQSREQLMRNQLVASYENSPPWVLASEAYRRLDNYMKKKS